MFNELNKKRTIKEGLELSTMPFVKLRDLIGREIRVDGFFFTEGDYGKQVVVVGNAMKINMPARAVAMFEDIRANEQMVNALLEGHCKLTNIREGQTKKGTAILFDLADC